MRRVSLTVQMLAGLVAGLGVGVAISATDLSWLRGLVPVAEPIGTVFVNAIRMTVIPLIVSKLVLAVAQATDERTLRRVGGLGLSLFLVTVALASGFAVVAGDPLMAWLPIDAGVAAGLRESTAGAGAAAGSRSLPGVAEWIVGLVPANAFKAAVDGAMLPLIVMALAFGFALTRLKPGDRETVVKVVAGVAGAMLVLVRWILAVAPVGVFALALPLAARLGLSAAGVLAYYIALVGLACVVFALVVLYPAATLLGRVALADFVRAAAPVQAFAFSSRSSLATLPVMIEAARSRLGLRESVSDLFLPLAAAMFRAGTAIGLTIAALFVARLYAVPLGPGALVAIVLTVIVTSLGSPGIPSGSILVIVPVLTVAGLPVEAVGVLLGVDTLPDMFRTTTNVTADMAAVTVVARLVPEGAGRGARA